MLDRKPPANSLADIKTMKDAARSSGKKLAVGFKKCLPRPM